VAYNILLVKCRLFSVNCLHTKFLLSSVIAMVENVNLQADQRPGIISDFFFYLNYSPEQELHTGCGNRMRRFSDGYLVNRVEYNTIC
jgi:hypothetical protein